MVKVDPHNHEKFYKSWKDKGQLMEGIAPKIRTKVIEYLDDMEIGHNIAVGSTKGGRSYGRLRNLKSKLHTVLEIYQNELKIKTVKALEKKQKDILEINDKMRKGKFKARKNKGKPLQSIGTYLKVFKAFWHWYQKTERQKGREVPDITIDFDTVDPKPKFIYLTEANVNKLIDHANFKYRTLILFLYDSGIRAPTELMNLKKSDFIWDEKENHYWLNIREETSKTFGRKFKLLLSSSQLKKYLKDFKNDDYVFQIATPQKVNDYLSRLAYKVLGIGKPERKKYGDKTNIIIKDGVSLYDFRHSSACYWYPKYPQESSFKYRFGWRKSEMIYYYTEFLGMKDTLERENLYSDSTKTDLEKKLAEQKKEIELIKESNLQMKEMLEEYIRTTKLELRVK